MTGPSQELQGKRAGVKRTPASIAVYAVSGRGLLSSDPQSFIVTLPGNASDEDVGLAVSQALDASRFLSTEEASIFFRREEASKRSEEIILALMTTSNINNRRAFFKDVKLCHISCRSEALYFEPTRRHGAEGFEGLGAESSLSLPSTASISDIGAALASALDRSR